MAEPSNSGPRKNLTTCATPTPNCAEIESRAKQAWACCPLQKDEWHAALPAEQLPVGKLTKVWFAGKSILLARLEDGTPVAASVICPHQQADLSQGKIYMGAVDCPSHHYLYDLRTGVNRYPRDVFPADLAAQLAHLPLFRVKEEDGWLWVADRAVADRAVADTAAADTASADTASADTAAADTAAADTASDRERDG